MLLDLIQNASQLMRAILEEELDNTVINFMRLVRWDFAYLLMAITLRIRRQDYTKKQTYYKTKISGFWW